jgi:hypothetical protein
MFDDGPEAVNQHTKTHVADLIGIVRISFGDIDWPLYFSAG